MLPSHINKLIETPFTEKHTSTHTTEYKQPHQQNRTRRPERDRRYEKIDQKVENEDKRKEDPGNSYRNKNTPTRNLLVTYLGINLDRELTWN